MNTPTLLRDLRHTSAALAAAELLGPEQTVQSLPTPTLHVNGRPVVSWCSNNYLGLNHRPEVTAAAVAALTRFSHATSESRRLGGNLAILGELEAALAEFKGTDAAVLAATGLLANIAAVHGVLDIPRLAHQWFGSPLRPQLPVVIYDQLAHRSIAMGASLARADRARFRHNDPTHLAELLHRHRGHPTLVVTDGVFSMDGDLANLPAIVEVCDTHDALLMVDDAHGTGVYGTTGTGVVEHLGLSGRVPLQVVTLSKALGGMGGAICTDRSTAALLRTFASGYRFTSSLPAEQAAATLAALHILRTEPEVREVLWTNIRQLRAGLARLGVTAPGDGPIMPLIVGTHATATAIEQRLLDRGLLCPAVTPPAVAADRCRIRLTVTAMHSGAQIDALLTALDELHIAGQTLCEPADGATARSVAASASGARDPPVAH